MAAWFPVFGLLALLLYVPLSLMAVVLAKRAIVGTYRAGRWPVWGGFYIRHWAVCQLVRLVPWRLLEGTAFQAAALRALGARIGQRVHIHRGVESAAGRMGSARHRRRRDDRTGGHAPAGGPRGRANGGGADHARRRRDDGDARERRRRRRHRHGRLSDGAVSACPPGARVPARARWDGVPAGPAGLRAGRAGTRSVGATARPKSIGAAMMLLRLAGALLTPTLAATLSGWYWLVAVG